MDRIKDNPFERRLPTLEELKVHAEQLAFPGWEKMPGATKPKLSELSKSPEAGGLKKIANSLGEVALGGAQA